MEGPFVSMLCLCHFFRSEEAPTLFFTERELKRQILNLELAFSLAWTPLISGKGKPIKGRKWCTTKMLICRRQWILLFSQSLQCLSQFLQWKKKGWNEKDTTALSSTYYIPLENTGKAETGQTCSLLSLQPLYIPFIVSNVTLERSYHFPLTASRLYSPNNTRPKYRVMNCTLKNQIAPSPFNALHSDLLV